MTGQVEFCLGVMGSCLCLRSGEVRKDRRSWERSCHCRSMLPGAAHKAVLLQQPVRDQKQGPLPEARHRAMREVVRVDDAFPRSFPVPHPEDGSVRELARRIGADPDEVLESGDRRS